MKPTKEELAAYADGELDAARTAEIAAMVENDPDLASEVAAHRALRQQLGAHFAPILDQPVPERLTQWAKQQEPVVEPQVVDFTAKRERREQRRNLPRWTYFAAPAMAAALALALFLPRGGSDSPMANYANAQLATALDTQLAAQQGNSNSTRILISFRNHGGEYCRAFSDPEQSGIACRDNTGWRLADVGPGTSGGGTTYRQAGSDYANLMAKAQDMAAGPALNASAEQEARSLNWLPTKASLDPKAGS